jgi:hypothetical protein
MLLTSANELMAERLGRLLALAGEQCILMEPTEN